MGKATAGCDLQFSVRIELGGDPPQEVVETANKVLAEVSEAMALR